LLYIFYFINDVNTKQPELTMKTKKKNLDLKTLKTITA